MTSTGGASTIGASMTFAEQVLARASGRDQVSPGDVVVAEVDRLVMHDLSGYLTTRVLEEEVKEPVRHPDRVIMVFDHHFSPPNEKAAEILQWNRDWARRHGIHLFDCGSGNIHHAAFTSGLIRPGMIVVGSDSHTPVHGAVGALGVALGNNSHAATVMPHGKAWFKVPQTVRLELEGDLATGVTPRDVALWLVSELGEGGAIYAALEFGGPLIDAMSFWDRWLFPLITVDVGAKCGYVVPDATTAATVAALPGPASDRAAPTAVARPADVRRFDVSHLGPQVACPPTVGHVKPVESVLGTEVSWVELGGHGGGRVEDIRIAADVLAGRQVHPDVRFNVVPSSRAVFAQCLEEGLVARLHAAGATWFPPSAGSNQAYNMGAMTAREAMISTHARNFPGRNGSSEARMYLASAATVAAAALDGTIRDPREVMA